MQHHKETRRKRL